MRSVCLGSTLKTPKPSCGIELPSLSWMRGTRSGSWPHPITRGRGIRQGGSLVAKGDCAMRVTPGMRARRRPTAIPDAAARPQPATAPGGRNTSTSAGAREEVDEQVGDDDRHQPPLPPHDEPPTRRPRRRTPRGRRAWRPAVAAKNTCCRPKIADGTTIAQNAGHRPRRPPCEYPRYTNSSVGAFSGANVSTVTTAMTVSTARSAAITPVAAGTKTVSNCSNASTPSQREHHAHHREDERHREHGEPEQSPQHVGAEASPREVDEVAGALPLPVQGASHEPRARPG